MLNRRVLCAVTSLLIVLGSVGCGQGAGTNGDGAPSIPSIAIAVTAPTALANTTGKVRFSGTLTPSAPGVTGLAVTLKVKGTTVGSAQGGTFSVDVDTTAKTSKGKPLFKDGKVCVTLLATGSGGASGSTSHCITSDNSAPTVEIGAPLDNSVHIGKVLVTGRVTEKYIKDVSVSIDGKRVVGFCNEKRVGPDKKPLCSLAACVEKFGTCLTGSGNFSVLADRGSQPTKVVTIEVKATDLTDHTTTSSRSVTVLRPPTWDVAHTFGPLKPDGTPDNKLGQVRDLLAYDFNRDKTLDTLVATATGVWLMLGQTAGGKATGKLGAPQLVSSAPLTQLLLTDIDGDKIKDVYGIGRLSPDAPDNETGAMALLTKEGGVRPVAQLPLKGQATAIGAGDIDKNGVVDLIVGAKEDDYALQLIPAVAPEALLCPSKDEPKRTCKSVKSVAELGPATIFGSPQLRAMTGGISVIAVADFDATDNAEYPDILVGRSKVATLSMCRNTKGAFIVSCTDTQKNDFTADLSDSSLLVPVDWNTDGKMDVIVASKGAGVVRWLTGTGTSTFSYKPGAAREIFLKNITSLSIGPVGPVGKDYVMVGHGGRTVTFIPVQTDDRSHRDKCFRSWILGGSTSVLRHGDLNGDGKVDLLAVDNAPGGVAVALSRGGGNYHAATVHRVCGLRKGTFLFGTLPVAKFKLGDVSADGKPDLLLMSNAVTSRRSAKFNKCQSKTDKTKFTPQPAHVLHLYVNEGKQLEEAARAGEWGPYTTPGLQAQHGVKEVGEGTCGTSMADLSGLEFGEFNGTPPLDMVISRKQDYTAGTPPEGAAECPFREDNEIANLFGLQKGGTESSPGPFCKNFKDEDEKKKQPLSSARGGAPLLRASVVTFFNADPAKPFGLTTSNRPDDPVEIRPQFMFAGGRKPISLVVGRFDGDDIDDIATLMSKESSPQQRDYLAPRVRIFRATPAKEGGIVKPVLYFKQGTDQAKDYNKENPTTQKLLVGVDQQATWSHLNDKGVIDETIPVSYLIPDNNPRKMRAARYCKTGPFTSLFTLNAVDANAGSFSVLRAQGSLVVDPPVTYSAGKDLGGFGVVDADGDKCTDVLFAKKDQLAFAKGMSQTFQANKYFFPINFGSLAAVEVFDVNSDGTLDMVLVDSQKSRVHFYLNDGAGNFVEVPDVLPVLQTAGDLQIADIDGDGCNDLAIQGSNGVAVVMSLACQ